MSFETDLKEVPVKVLGPRPDYDLITKKLGEFPSVLFQRDNTWYVSAESDVTAALADFYEEHVREYRDEHGRIRNAFGISDSLHAVATRHGMYWEWVNPGCIAAYEE